MSRSWNGKEEVVGQDERDQEELPEGEATVLPEREAMSLITSDLNGPDLGAAGEEITSEDRDERVSESDSASPQT